MNPVFWDELLKKQDSLDSVSGPVDASLCSDQPVPSGLSVALKPASLSVELLLILGTNEVLSFSAGFRRGRTRIS